jgi:hypothetical protein
MQTRYVIAAIAFAAAFPALAGTIVTTAGHIAHHAHGGKRAARSQRFCRG